MEIQGKVKLIGETQTFGANGFRKRELVITTEEHRYLLKKKYSYLLMIWENVILKLKMSLLEKNIKKRAIF